jgi:hypothetical protein
VHAKQLFAAHGRRFAVGQQVEHTGSEQLVLDHIDALRTFRMKRPGLVQAAGRVRDKCGGHAGNA